MSEQAVTELLLRLDAGHTEAVEQLFPLVYKDLRRVAGSLLRQERAGHTLQPTALVNEAYLRLTAAAQLGATCRAQFFGIAARAMRQILIDHARARHAAKRGGNVPRVSLEEGLAYSVEQAPHILAVNEALEELAKLDERKARVVELRYFGGLTGEEIALVLNIGRATVTRDLRMAEAWLARALSPEDSRDA